MNIEKHTIICIVGASGAGKTVLSMELYKQLNIPYICSYTTRPMRDGETNGVEHIFVSENEIPDKSEMFAYTLFGDYHYWTTWKQINQYRLSTYVIDEKGILWFKEHCNSPEYKILFVKVIRDNLSSIDKERLNRDNDRIEIPDSTYDIIIHNNGTIDDMVKDFSIKISHNNLLFN